MTEQEKVVLRRLALFPAGFDIAAAEAVLLEPETLAVVSRLIDKSLVVSFPAGDTARYACWRPYGSTPTSGCRRRERPSRPGARGGTALGAREWESAVAYGALLYGPGARARRDPRRAGAGRPGRLRPTGGGWPRSTRPRRPSTAGSWRSSTPSGVHWSPSSVRLRDAVRRIADALPELGAHLDRSLVTGASCRYQPREPLTWTVSA